MRILSVLYMQQSLTALEPYLSAQMGVPVKIEIDQTANLVQRVSTGEDAALIVVAKSTVEQLAAQGHVVMKKDVAKSFAGVAVADTLPLPVLKTSDDFRSFLVGVPSLALSRGPSGVYVAKLIDTYGLTEVMKSKVLTTDGLTGDRLMKGETVAAIQQLSELHLAGAKKIVPLPDALQSGLVVSVAAISKSSRPAAEVNKLAELLSSAQASQAYEKSLLRSLVK